MEEGGRGELTDGMPTSYDSKRVSIRRTRLARLVKGIALAILSQTVAAVSAIASIFMPLAGGIGSQTLVLTGWTNTYKTWTMWGVATLGDLGLPGAIGGIGRKEAA